MNTAKERLRSGKVDWQGQEQIAQSEGAGDLDEVSGVHAQLQVTKISFLL